MIRNHHFKKSIHHGLRVHFIIKLYHLVTKYQLLAIKVAEN